MKKATKEKGGIQSLERAFAILEQVASRRDGINLSELSKAVGLHNSTTFHLLKTMVQLGYVTQMRESKRYRIGSRLFTLAAGALEENSLLEIATPVLEKLSRDTGEAAHFAIRSGNEVVVIVSGVLVAVGVEACCWRWRANAGGDGEGAGVSAVSAAPTSRRDTSHNARR